MLKIVETTAHNGRVILELEGRVIGPWVDELRRVCERTFDVGAGLTLDVARVQFVDRDGLALLRSLRLRDVTLVHCSGFVAAQLEGEVMDIITAGDPEPQLVQRLRGGDHGALEILMERYASRVYRLAHGITRNAPDAEEVVQDVFLKLFRVIDAFEGRSALGTWIYRIATNEALNKRRGKRREVEVPIEEHLPSFQADGHREGDRAFLLSDWSASPELATLTAETRARVRAAIDALPDNYRVVLLLRDLEELSNDEAAEVLGEPVSSVKSRLHRARMALREMLTRSPDRLGVSNDQGPRR